MSVGGRGQEIIIGIQSPETALSPPAQMLAESGFFGIRKVKSGEGQTPRQKE